MKSKALRYSPPKPQPRALKEVTVAAGIGEVISVRAAKTHLSALLDLVAAGREVTITSDGKPKAKLIGAPEIKNRKAFQGMGDYLSSQPVHGGPSAEELVREDRDSRGW